MATSVTPLVNVNGFAIRDILAHSYRTDPTNIAILPLGDHQPPLRCYGVWIYNTTGQPLTVQLIGNIVANQSYPDFSIGSPQTVAAGAVAFLVVAFQDLPTDYISVQLQFATQPGSGTVYGALKYYI